MDNNDLFSASLETINTDKRVEKYQRFKDDFRRECFVTLDNAQEWIKAELPIVTEYIDVAAIKDELKQPNTSKRRKLLLSALLFEKNLRLSIKYDNAAQSAMMALHMVNQIWQAKVELYGLQPIKNNASKKSNSTVEEFDEKREKILTTLIKKSKKLQQDSQIQSQIKSQIRSQQKSNDNKHSSEVKKTNKDFSSSKKPTNTSSKNTNKQNHSAKTRSNKFKKKSNSVFSKVKTKLPLKRKNKYIAKLKQSPEHDTEHEDLFDNPNQSAIIVNPGFSKNIDDSIIKAREEVFKEQKNASVTVHKVLKDREHDKQKPGMQTVVMKLASSAGKRKSDNLTIPEQCQDAINALTKQFPGYDMVAIRNMAAEKVGVSPQYIENLNILPN